MRLLVLLAYDPGLHAILDHVINGDPVPQVDSLLDTKDSENLKLDRGQVVEHLVELDVLTGLLDAFVNCNNQLVRLFDCQLSLRIHNCLHARLDELLLEDAQVLKVTLLVDEVVLKRSN